MHNQASADCNAQAGKAGVYLLGVVMLLAAAVFFYRQRGMPGGGDPAGAAMPPEQQIELQRALERWAATLKARDLTGHVRIYSDPAFYFGRSRTRQEIWLRKKKLLDDHPAFNTFEINGLKVEKFERGLATLTFTLRYDYGPGGVPPQNGTAVERLTCRNSGDDWKIESEYIESER